jgi:hypothetical protein
MIDTTTRKPLRVSKLGTAPPFIRVPISQLDELRELLDGHKVRYRVEDEAVSLDGGPEIGIVDLGRGEDPAAVQALLDAAR